MRRSAQRSKKRQKYKKAHEKAILALEKIDSARQAMNKAKGVEEQSQRNQLGREKRDAAQNMEELKGNIHYSYSWVGTHDTNIHF